ncbi:MAG TPA: peptide ABC transporter ATP-binding protein [Myxococcales bacterium]|nr:peptide ABC transporter ATP-binding protein [Myxococcales bacterium]
MAAPLLQIKELRVIFGGDRAEGHVLDGVSLEVHQGEAVGVVGESGCGKTTLALSILRLLPPAARVRAGAVLLEGVELLGLSESAMRRVRGKRIGMVFQEPASALNPVLTIGEQVAEVARLHEGLNRRQARARASEALHEAGLASPERWADAYPHQMSGGMRQRAVLAMALAGHPALLLADEPTTALDPTVEAQVLALLGRLRKERGLAVLLISHDFLTVSELCDRVVVLYAGQVVEQGPARVVFEKPRHPYSRALLDCLPDESAQGALRHRSRLRVIPGASPEVASVAEGCRFANRCARGDARCRTSAPQLQEVAEAHRVRCFRPLDEVAQDKGRP